MNELGEIGRKECGKIIKYRIVNLVAYTNISEQLDLDHIKRVLDNCEYEPEVYFALIYRLSEPKLSILVNRSGKIIFAGAKSVRNIQKARDLFFDDLISVGYHPKKRKISIQNIVIAAELGRELDFKKILYSNSRGKIQYEPEVFPSIIFKNNSPRFTALIFRNGKICIVGLKNFKSIRSAVELIDKMVEGR